MRNTSVVSWVKNVYNPLFLRISTWKNSGSLSPTIQSTENFQNNIVNIYPVSHRLIPAFTQLISTSFFRLRPLLITSFYTVSTAPIINPKKEKEER